MFNSFLAIVAVVNLMNKDLQSEERIYLFSEVIQVARNKFEAKLGKPPKFLYLEPNMKALLLSEFRHILPVQHFNQPDDIKTFMGMTVVEMVVTVGCETTEETWGLGL